MSTEIVQVVPGAIVPCVTVTRPLLPPFEVVTTASPPGPVPAQVVPGLGTAAMKTPTGSVSVYETPVSVRGDGAFGSNVEIRDIWSVDTWLTAT